MVYIPNNVDNWNAAFTGALAGLIDGRNPTSSDGDDYALFSATASSWAIQIDGLLGTSAFPNSILNVIGQVSQALWQGKTPDSITSHEQLAGALIGLFEAAFDAMSTSGGGVGAKVPNIVSVKDATAWHVIQGGAAQVVITGVITVAAGSRIVVQAMAAFVGSVDKGRAFMDCPDFAELGSSTPTASYDATDNAHHSLNFLGTTDPQVAAGDVTVTITMNVNGAAGSRIDGESDVQLLLIEAP